MKSLIKKDNKEFIKNASLPVYNNTRNGNLTYTVIPHNFIINTVEKELENNNYKILNEKWICTDMANVAIGIYTIDYGTDFKMTYSVTNSYNKQVRFKSAVGIVYEPTGTVMIARLNDWQRKHTGTADIEAGKTITDQLFNSKKDYDEIMKDIEYLKGVWVNKIQYCNLIGRLFGMEILSSSQLNIMHKEYKKPTVPQERKEEFGKNKLVSMFELYLAACTGLKEDHPVTYMQHLTKCYNEIMAFAQEIKPRNTVLFEMFDMEQEENKNVPFEQTIDVPENDLPGFDFDIDEKQELSDSELDELMEQMENRLSQMEESKEPVEDLDVIFEAMEEEANEKMKDEIAQEEYLKEHPVVEHVYEEAEEEQIRKDVKEEIQTIEEQPQNSVLDEQKYFNKNTYNYNIGECFEHNNINYKVIDILFDDILVCKEK